MERGGCFGGAAVDSGIAFQGGCSWCWIISRQIPGCGTLHSGCPVLVVAPRKVHLCWTGTFLRVPTLCRDRGGTRWDRPRSQEQLDICGEMRDAVGTSPLSGKSESWYGSVHESNRKTYSGETPQRDQCPTLGIRNLLWNSFCSPSSSWLERHMTWCLCPGQKNAFYFN